MAGLIFSSFSHLTREEAHAIADYLKSIPPVRHRPEEPSPREASSVRTFANARGLAADLSRPTLLSDPARHIKLSGLRR